MQMGLKTNHVKKEFKKLLWSSVSKLEAGPGAQWMDAALRSAALRTHHRNSRSVQGTQTSAETTFRQHSAWSHVRF